MAIEPEKSVDLRYAEVKYEGDNAIIYPKENADNRVLINMRSIQTPTALKDNDFVIIRGTAHRAIFENPIRGFAKQERQNYRNWDESLTKWVKLGDTVTFNAGKTSATWNEIEYFVINETGFGHGRYKITAHRKDGGELPSRIGRASKKKTQEFVDYLQATMPFWVYVKGAKKYREQFINPYDVALERIEAQMTAEDRVRWDKASDFIRVRKTREMLREESGQFLAGGIGSIVIGIIASMILSSGSDDVSGVAIGLILFGILGILGSILHYVRSYFAPSADNLGIEEEVFAPLSTV